METVIRRSNSLLGGLVSGFILLGNGFRLPYVPRKFTLIARLKRLDERRIRDCADLNP
jgi:hypothetical protein